MTHLPTLGTDPELVTTAVSMDILRKHGLPEMLVGKPIPAYFALDITDVENPGIALPHGTLTPDGMAVEFTTPPSASVDEMVRTVFDNLNATRNLLLPKGITLSVDPHFDADFEYIARLPEEYGKACSLQILGCAPDFCAYDGVDLPHRPDPKEYPYRTTGGHIHVQVGNEILADSALFCFTVAAMDSILGTASGYLCTSDSALRRMALYGSAGMCRMNHTLGTFEYRTLPAQALVQTEKVARLMFSAASAVCGHIMDVIEAETQPNAVKYLAEKFGTYGDLLGGVIPAINTHNIDLCRELQYNVGNRLSDCATIATVINEMQAYSLPDTFELQWDWKEIND